MGSAGSGGPRKGAMAFTPKQAPGLSSLVLHGALLGWVACGPPPGAEEAPRSLYAQVIAPHEHKLVWYTFREKLPDVSPLERHGISQPPEARVKARQEVVSQAKAPRARQLIWEPAPRLELKQEGRSPNLLAGAPATQAPKPKLFVPPPERTPAGEASLTLEAAPQIAAARPPGPPALPMKMARPVRSFTAPEEQPGPQVKPLALEAAPVLPGAKPGGGAVGLPTEMARPVRQFTVPQGTPAGEAGGGGSAPALPDAPAVNAAPGSGSVRLAVVGLAPTERLEGPLPEGWRPARFPAGPEVRNKGGDGEPVNGARIFVPDLMVRGGGPAPAKPVLVARAAPTSIANLQAALRTQAPVMPGEDGGAAASEPPPDPSFAGRVVYRLAIQMPNVSSYSGSWTLWFAERDLPERAHSAMRLPVPLRKVDPKYYASAMADRVEGNVRLRGVIGTDGHVAQVALLQKLDDRLDRSAEEALSKWEFAPAERAGAPVAVDVIVEIPFRLKPEKAK